MSGTLLSPGARNADGVTERFGAVKQRLESCCVELLLDLITDCRMSERSSQFVPYFNGLAAASQPTNGRPESGYRAQVAAGPRSHAEGNQYRPVPGDLLP